MVYRLDVMEAYNKRLVKKIAVKGITEMGTTATESYVYLESINLSKKDPTATIQFEIKGTKGPRKVSRIVGIGFNLYDNSGGLEEDRDGFVVKFIDGRDDSIEFLNGIRMYAGDIIGKVDEIQLRRIQIRETILSHIQREHQLFYKGIKVLYLFFIDEVTHYRQYNASGQVMNGEFAKIFEEEYENIVSNLQLSIVFNQFKDNPEEFIIKAAGLINDEKATAIIEHITYDILNEHYDTDVFTEPTIKGRLGMNAMKVKKHLYDHIVYDSSNEQTFATELDTNTNVAVYVKLPNGFYISTPVGRYNPDWAIAFYEGTVKHIYFVAETKGSMSSMQLRLIEESKIHCAREHFKAISSGNVVHDVVDSYQTLLDKVMR